LGEALRLSTVCVVALAVVFLAGLAPGLFAQAEIAKPGLQLVSRETDYNLAVTIHGLIFGCLLPLVGLALSLAVLSELRQWRIARIGAYLALAAAPLLAIAVAAGVFRAVPFTRPWYYSLSLPELVLPIEAAAGLIVQLTLAVVAKGRRRPAVIFAVLAGIVLIQAIGQQVVMATMDVHGFLHGTYYVVASSHAAGVCVAFNIFGALALWSMRWDGVRRGWFSLVAGVAMLVTGSWAAREASYLGAMGMPRGYVDYPGAFATAEGSLALWSFAFAAVLFAVIALLALVTALTRKPPGVETLFE
jgi:heme/copper-type cytochrome/quinol oxidase subunit 1